MPRKLSKLGEARNAALRGEIDAALPVIAARACGGDAHASVSLAELLAFLWRWEEVIPAAARLVADPFAVRIGNAFNDMIRLLGRAAEETGRWDLVAEAGRAGSREIVARLDANDMGYPAEKIRWGRTSLPTICDRLVEFCACKGAPPHHDEIDFFHLPRQRPCERAAYEKAVAEMAHRGTQHRLSLAIVHGVEDEAIRAFDELGVAPLFDQAVFVAGVHARHGRDDAAWAVIEAAWRGWLPLDLAQVAPTALLTDRHLRGVITAERSESLLRRPHTAQWR